MSFDFDFTEAKLRQCVPAGRHLDQWFLALQEILPDYNINTVNRVACFIGQTAHESGQYTVTRENLNYKADGLKKIFPRYFKDVDANAYAHNPEKIANRVYSGRMGNGDETSGDGYRFRGRGLVQLTGRSNYQAFADSIEITLEEVVPFLETFEGAVQSACWFWENNNLNSVSDNLDIKKMTKIINGGYIGLEDRQSHIQHALQVLSR